MPGDAEGHFILGVIRTVWLLLAIFCTSLVGVQPLQVSVDGHCTCACHCKEPGACGMPCTRTATVSHELAAGEASLRIAKPLANARAETIRQLQHKFFAPFVEPPSSAVAVHAPAAMAPRPAVPLFEAHCSLLI